MKKILFVVIPAAAVMLVILFLTGIFPAREAEVLFAGEIGEQVNAEQGKIFLSLDDFSPGDVRYYHTTLPNEPLVPFFVVKDAEGIFRSAVNACRFCAGSRLGFSLQGENMVCEVCGNPYPLKNIGTEEGECTPHPVSAELSIQDGMLVIDEAELIRSVESMGVPVL